MTKEERDALLEWAYRHKIPPAELALILSRAKSYRRPG